MHSIRIILLIFIFVTMISVASAQDTGGALDGTVSDPDGNALVGAVVTAVSSVVSVPVSVSTDAGGYFRLSNLPVGQVEVTISSGGFSTVTIPTIIVRLGRTTPLGSVRLSTEANEVETMVVSSTAVPIDMYSAAVGNDLLRSEMDDLPVQRDYRELAKLLPEINTSFLGDEVSFSGSTGMDNRYFIDGMDVTGPYRGVFGMRLPYNFVEAVEVRSGGYEAEYRSSMGGILNVVTTRGRDEFQGSVFGFVANNRLSGETREGAIEPAKGDFRDYDGGFTLSGPISPGKAWYAVAYNPAYTSEEVEIPGTGLHDDISRRHSFAGKADWRPSQNLTVNLAVVADPESRDSVGDTWLRATFGAPVDFANADPHLGKMKTGGVSGQLRADWLAGDNLDLSIQISHLTQKHYLMPFTERGLEEWMFLDSATSTVSDGFPVRIDATAGRTSIATSGRAYLGNHTLSAGLEYRDNFLDNKRFELGLVTRVNDANFSLMTWDVSGEVHNTVPSVYLQDNWRLNDRLRLNAGIRWDGQYLKDAGGNTVQSITNQYQPRAGIVFQPGTPGTQRITGSYGRFYHDLALYGASLYHNPDAELVWTGYDHDPRVDSSGGDSYLSSLVIDDSIDLEGQHYDEFTLGYERTLSADFSIGVRGVYRTQRQAIEDGLVGPVAYWGNPGRGQLADYPQTKRDYKALVVSTSGRLSRTIELRASYVLSRLEGNYSGLFQSDLAIPFPTNGAFDIPEIMQYADGLLPNDRTHVFKLSGTWRADFGLSVGTFLELASGSPYSEFEGTVYGPPYFAFTQQRGTAGRTPSIWDLNLRFTYDLGQALNKTSRTRLIADVFHVGSRRKAVNYDQVRNFALDPGSGEQIVPNLTFGQATRYQPPMTFRMGLELLF